MPEADQPARKSPASSPGGAKSELSRKSAWAKGSRALRLCEKVAVSRAVGDFEDFVAGRSDLRDKGASRRGMIALTAPPAQGMPFRVLSGCERLATARRFVALAHNERWLSHGESPPEDSETFSKYRPTSPSTCLATVIRLKSGPLLPPW